jgi:hypothetical protein
MTTLINIGCNTKEEQEEIKNLLANIKAKTREKGHVNVKAALTMYYNSLKDNNALQNKKYREDI